ncbi:aromatic ring-opening dioxygenase catalytic subunit (LigB family) [Novosphingobium sp. PhB165]|uniref:DODA-type extradiol aromatic ring-opening family dioxygenase n=1 Tax=Novosphingobium sp. PhB165 TaxID=2485105 RepID=UPI0010525B11|nr:class III extradiol ring-cleavage dioxygenase [Novosphingobium sp. PhB165]TCM18149.1 aromatic ring-opening dioxygenase catalytic subunit (LigB family) [Novosphingobium sp. PhB165]
MTRQPTFFIPHGGGPCFFMDDPKGNWTTMAEFLDSLPARLPEPPKAILVVSGHWETDGFAFTGAEHPTLLFDYYGFPQHTYELRFDAPGAPGLAARAAGLLQSAGFTAAVDPQRGYDHGVFIPLKVAWPNADVPVVEMSLDRSLDPAMHLAAGKALAPLRDEGVLILGSGMSFHNMRGYGNPQATAPSQAFDQWLGAAATAPAESRAEALTHWAEAPGGRFSHPREEHLLPLMVAAGASEAAGETVWSDLVLSTAISAYRFD